jgi:hypothetical protein
VSSAQPLGTGSSTLQLWRCGCMMRWASAPVAQQKRRTSPSVVSAHRLDPHAVNANLQVRRE